jgi:nicotinate-nucleotide adenylyltransferase
VKVAVFGGSFNPPHVSHVLACVLLLSAEGMERVLVVPAFKHPFAKTLAPFDERLAMCRLAMEWIPGVTISSVEAEIGGESRTLHTLRAIAALHPDWELRLAIGADILGEAPRWLGFDEIARLAPPIVLGRAGTEDPRASALRLPDVSSTQVRAAIARKAWSEVDGLVPRSVLHYVREHGLYGDPEPGGR